MKFWKEVSPFSGQGIEEDAPANSVAGAGVSMPPDAVHNKKKKKEIQTRIGGQLSIGEPREGTKIDARTKSYRQHRAKLESAREKRARKSSRFIEDVKKNSLNVQLEGPPGSGGDVLANVQTRADTFSKKDVPLKKHRKKEMPKFPDTKMPILPPDPRKGKRPDALGF